MSEQAHPSELNPVQLYLRTTKVVRTTSRMKNTAWYQDALDLDVQVHCYIRHEGDVDCYLFDKSLKTFEKIEGLTQRQLQMTEELEDFVHRVLELDTANKAKALGIVFYLADELSIAGLGPEYQNPADMDDLRALMVEAPTEVLDDKTVSFGNTRMAPFSLFRRTGW